MKNARWFSWFLIIVAVLVLVILLSPKEIFGQEQAKKLEFTGKDPLPEELAILDELFKTKEILGQDTIDFVVKAELNKIQKMPKECPFDSSTLVVIWAYSSGEDEKGTGSRDADLRVMRAKVAKEWCEIHGLIVDNIILGQGEAGERGVIINQIGFTNEGFTEFEDFKSEVKEFNSDTEYQVNGLKKSLARLSLVMSGRGLIMEAQGDRLDILEKKKYHNWSLLVGWHTTSFGKNRDLSVPAAGLRFAYKSYFIQILGGINPWSKQGYKGYAYRDALGTASLGYNFYEHKQWTLNVQAGGLVGWEFTSETNKFALQILGIMVGLGVEREVKENISVGLSLNFIHAETSDVTIQSGHVRDGVYGLVYIKVF